MANRGGGDEQDELRLGVLLLDASTASSNRGLVTVSWATTR